MSGNALASGLSTARETVASSEFTSAYERIQAMTPPTAAVLDAALDAADRPQAAESELSRGEWLSPLELREPSQPQVQPASQTPRCRASDKGFLPLGGQSGSGVRPSRSPLAARRKSQPHRLRAACRKIRQVGGPGNRVGRPVAKRAAKWYHSSMTATLTPEQVAELERSGGSPLVVENPRTRQGYVLVPREAYQHAQPLFEAIIGHTRAGISPEAADSAAASGWDDSRNARRCVLIDKKYDEGLSPPEEAELDRLQDQLAAHQRLVSPRPVVILQLLEEALQQRAINATGRV